MKSLLPYRWMFSSLVFTLVFYGFILNFAGNAVAQPAVKKADKDAESLREQTIYIPYGKLNKVFEQPGRGVFLPYEKFQQLWKQANKNAATGQPMRAPLRSLIKVIDSEANVRQDVVVVTANLTIELVGDGWHEVPLNLADAAILSAKLDDKDGRVVRRGDGYSLLVEVPKADGDEIPTIELPLKLQYAKAFSRSPGLNRFSIAAPRASVNRWKIRVPEKGVKIQVEPMVAASEEDNLAGQKTPLKPTEETVLSAFFGVTPSVVISWTPKAEGASGLKALATVQARQMVTIGEGVQRTQAELIYQISRAKLAELKLRVPSTQKVTGVYDDNVRQWEVTDAGEHQEILVQLYEPTVGTQKLSVELERFDIGLGMESDMQVAVVGIPAVEALEVARQQGIVLVQIAQGLQAEVAKRSGLLQVDANKVAGKNWQFAYRYAALPFSLDLKVEKVAPEISSKELVEIQFTPQRIRSSLTAVFEIKRAGVFQLGLLIPEGYRIRTLRGQKIGDVQALQIDGYHKDEQKPTRYDVNLSRKAMGKVGLIVNIEKTLSDPNLVTPTGKASEYKLQIPRVDPDRVERVNGNIVVNAPISLRVTPEEVSGARSVSFNEAFSSIPRVQTPPAQIRPVHSYEYSGEAISGTFSLIRRQPEVNVDQLMHVAIESGTVTYNVELHYQILYSGVKTLRLDVPTDLVGVIRNTSNMIQESPIEPQPEDVAEGYTAWALKSSQELIGNIRFTLTWKKEIDDLNVGSSTPLDLPYLVPQQVQRSSGQIVLSKSENLDVVPTDFSNLRPIDPDHDLLGSRKFANAAQAYEFHQDWTLQVKITRYDLEQIKPTAIERSLYRVRLDQNKNITVQALLLTRSVNQRIALNFPSGADMSSEPLKINGVETSLEYEGGGTSGAKKYYVPLRNATGNLPVLLEVSYRIKDCGGSIPVLSFEDDTAVHDCYLFLQIPEDWNLVDYTGDWDDYLPGSWIDALAANVMGSGSKNRPPQPKSEQIIKNMVQRAGGNIAVQNPLIGTPIPFTSLDPQKPIQVTAFAAKWLDLPVFIGLGIFALAGVGVWRKLGHQIVMLTLLMAFSVAIGILWPLISVEAISPSAAVTLIGIVFVWLAFDFARLFVGGSILNFAKVFKREEKAEVDVGKESTAVAESKPEVEQSTDDGDADNSNAENGENPFDDSNKEEN